MTTSPLSDYQNVKSDVLAALREVADVAEDAGAQSLAEGLREGRIPRLEQERFHLVVLGEFNHGKTTFVNALLGAPVLPSGVTPTTAVIHHVTHGAAPAATAVSENDSHGVPLEQVADFVVGGKAAEEDVKYLEVNYPAAILEGGVVLVDTPGVNDLNSARAKAELAQGTSSSIMSLGKLAMSRILHESARLRTDLLGATSLLEGPEHPRAEDANFLALNAYFTSIGGGTDQVQRNIIGERVLGLPKEPEIDKAMPFRDVKGG